MQNFAQVNKRVNDHEPDKDMRHLHLVQRKDAVAVSAILSNSECDHLRKFDLRQPA